MQLYLRALKYFNYHFNQAWKFEIWHETHFFEKLFSSHPQN